VQRGEIRVRGVVLGSTAAGIVAQWDCRCCVHAVAWACNALVKPGTRSILAVSADNGQWLVIKASPDIRQLAAAIRGEAA